MLGKSEQLTTTGKNLVNNEELKILDNYTDKNSTYYIYRLTGLITGEKYTLSCGEILKSGNTLLFGVSANQLSYDNAQFLLYDGLNESYNRKSITWTQENGDYVDLLFSYNSNSSQTTQEKLTEFFERVSYVQLEKGTSPTAYEPYTGRKPSPSPEYPQEIKSVGKWNPETQKYEVDIKVTNAKESWDKEQTITITSDRPITKWDRLIKKDGVWGWEYKSTLRFLDGNTDVSNLASSQKIITRYLIQTELKNVVINKYVLCSHLRQSEKWESDYECIRLGQLNTILYLYLDKEKFPNNESVKNWMKELSDKGTPLTVIYESDTEEFIPLTESEQQTLEALRTYYPTTVISADGGEVDPDVEVTYIADTKNYIDQKIDSVVKTVVETQKALL